MPCLFFFYPAVRTLWPCHDLRGQRCYLQSVSQRLAQKYLLVKYTTIVEGPNKRPRWKSGLLLTKCNINIDSSLFRCSDLPGPHLDSCCDSPLSHTHMRAFFCLFCAFSFWKQLPFSHAHIIHTVPLHVRTHTHWADAPTCVDERWML